MLWCIILILTIQVQKSKGTHKLSELTEANSESFIQWTSQKWNFHIFSWGISSSIGFPWLSARRILLPLQLNILTRFLFTFSLVLFLSLIPPTGSWNLCLSQMCYKKFFFFKYIIPGSTRNKRFVNTTDILWILPSSS